MRIKVCEEERIIMAKLWITTEDNPFDPFTQMDRWMNYDYQMGYNTCGLLARLSRCSHNLTEKENEDAIEDAVKEILRNIPYAVSFIDQHVVQYLPAIEGKTVAWK